MNITLKKFKHYPGMSEETNAFNADLYVNGERRGSVSNRGHGECIWFSDWATARQLEEYAKTLPNEPVYNLPMSAELLVGMEVERLIEEQQLKRWCRTKIVLRNPSAPKGQYELLKSQWHPNLKDSVNRKFPGMEIINERFA